MKKVFLIILITFFCTAQAQTKEQKFNLGVRGGLNYSNISGLNSHYKTAYYAGIYGYVAFTEHYALQPELTISQQGTENATYTGGTTNTPVNYAHNFNLKYATFSIINKFTFADKFNLMVGPSVDFATGDKTYLNSDIDVAISVGFGVKATKNLGIEVRFKKGLFDITDYGNNNDWFLVDYQYNTNILFQLGATYTFDFN
jgi:hypothetical protein